MRNRNGGGGYFGQPAGRDVLVRKTLAGQAIAVLIETKYIAKTHAATILETLLGLGLGWEAVASETRTFAIADLNPCLGRRQGGVGNGGC